MHAIFSKRGTGLCLLAAVWLGAAHAEPAPGPVDVKGARGSLRFEQWDLRHGSWSVARYQGPSGTFRLYHLPGQRSYPGAGQAMSASPDGLSPGGRYAMFERVEYGLVDQAPGESVESEQAYCEAIDLDSGCVVYSYAIVACDGQWQGERWQPRSVASAEFAKGPSPRDLARSAAGESDPAQRASGLLDALRVGVGAYTACHPASTDNLVDYNNIAFYLAQGGQHAVALALYEKLLALAPQRVPLQLNVADSLWAMRRYEQARPHYAAYRAAMLQAGSAASIPGRVEQRLARAPIQ